MVALAPARLALRRLRKKQQCAELIYTVQFIDSTQLLLLNDLADVCMRTKMKNELSFPVAAKRTRRKMQIGGLPTQFERVVQPRKAGSAGVEPDRVAVWISSNAAAPNDKIMSGTPPRHHPKTEHCQDHQRCLHFPPSHDFFFVPVSFCRQNRRPHAAPPVFSHYFNIFVFTFCLSAVSLASSATAVKPVNLIK